MIKIFGIFFIFLTVCESAKILFISSSISRSTVLPMQTLAKEMARRNHEVAVVSMFPENESIKNYREFKIELETEDKEVHNRLAKLLSANDKRMEIVSFLPNAFKTLFKIGNDTLQSRIIEDLKKEKFDLVVISYFFSEYLLGLADHFQCPSVVFFSAGPFSALHKMVGNPLSPEASQHFLISSEELNFFGRVKNFLVNSFDILVLRNVAYYKGKQIYDFNFPNARRSFDEILRNVSLVLVSTHFTSTGPRPNLPNMIEVGGLQAKPKSDPLPENLNKFVNGSRNGAILLSFGSNVKSSELPQETVTSMLKVFSKLKQRVVMKWETDELEGKPENVLISKWLPQDDILAHPKIKLFISHCGYGGLVESKSHGVPIICIPFAGDQFANSIKAVDEGWAIKISAKELNEETLSSAINEILTNPKYKQTVQRLSLLIKDRPMSALDTAVYWTEYVLRHHGAPHLHYPGADLNFFQYNSIDVILFIVAVIYIAVKIVRITCRAICCGKKSEQKLKTN